MTQPIICNKCRGHIFKVDKADNHYIMIECMECGDMRHEEVN